MKKKNKGAFLALFEELKICFINLIFKLFQILLFF
jgi:hypothetical protein